MFIYLTLEQYTVTYIHSYYEFKEETFKQVQIE